MPNPGLTAAIKEAYASVPRETVILNTLEITHPARASAVNKLDVCFCIDTTGSMGSIIETVKATAQQIIEDLMLSFISVRVALVTFKDEDATVTVPDAAFHSFATIKPFIEALTADGGDDTDENGYGAIKLAGDSFDWRLTSDVGRVCIVFTDAGSHTRGATKAQAITALTSRNIMFVGVFDTLGSDSSTSYDDVASGTGGENVAIGDGFVDDLVAAIKGVQTDTGTPLYLVQDRVEHDLTLENGAVKTFLPVGFKLTLPGQEGNGLQELLLQVDNTERQAGDFIESVIGYNIPVQIVFRAYLTTHTSEPQTAPLRRSACTIALSRWAEGRTSGKKVEPAKVGNPGRSKRSFRK